MSGGRFRDLAMAFARSSTHAGLPQISLTEDGETISAILQAVHPVPSMPITSLRLGLRCIAAANKYGLHPSLFRIDYSVFSDEATMAAPFDLCALAWCMGDWAVVQHASRFTHAMSVAQLNVLAAGLPRGSEVLAACLATRAERQRVLLDVASRLPSQLICTSCRMNGHNNASMALVRALGAFFNAPFPDMSEVFNNPEATWLPHLPVCPTNTCADAVRTVVYAPWQYQSIKFALQGVPQTIQSWVIRSKAADLRGELEGILLH